MIPDQRRQLGSLMAHPGQEEIYVLTLEVSVIPTRDCGVYPTQEGLQILEIIQHR